MYRYSAHSNQVTVSTFRLITFSPVIQWYDGCIPGHNSEHNMTLLVMQHQYQSCTLSDCQPMIIFKHWKLNTAFKSLSLSLSSLSVFPLTICGSHRAPNIVQNILIMEENIFWYKLTCPSTQPKGSQSVLKRFWFTSFFNYDTALLVRVIVAVAGETKHTAHSNYVSKYFPEG